jgi:death-on-curing protein
MESAIARPYQTFGGEDLYPTAIEKIAAIAESIIINHPFVDGNKRTGYLAVLAILDENNLELVASNDNIYSFVIKISTGEIKFEQIVEWLKQNTTSINPNYFDDTSHVYNAAKKYPPYFSFTITNL